MAERPIFENVLNKFTLTWEGGYSNHPADKGGETFKGIIKTVYDAYRTSKNLPIQSVKLISNQEISDIYFNNYWLVAGCDKLDDKFAEVVFDTAVNNGAGRAKKWLMLTKDYKEYMNIRENFYNKIVLNNPSQKVFLKGWMNRINALRKFVE